MKGEHTIGKKNRQIHGVAEVQAFLDWAFILLKKILSKEQ